MTAFVDQNTERTQLPDVLHANELQQVQEALRKECSARANAEARVEELQLRARELQQKLVEAELADEILRVQPPSEIAGEDAEASSAVVLARAERELMLQRERNEAMFAELQQQRDLVREADDRVLGLERNCARLVRKKKEILHTLRQERERRKRQAGELAISEEKVAALSEHIEKLMVALRIEAQAKQRQKSSEKGLAKRIDAEQRKCALLRKKALVAERAIVQLKEQAEMLSGQLQLADERYADLRSRLMLERKNKNTEAQFWKRMLEEREQDIRAASDRSSANRGSATASGARAVPARNKAKKASLRRSRDTLENAPERAAAAFGIANVVGDGKAKRRSTQFSTQPLKSTNAENVSGEMFPDLTKVVDPASDLIYRPRSKGALDLSFGVEQGPRTEVDISVQTTDVLLAPVGASREASGRENEHELRAHMASLNLRSKTRTDKP